MSILENKVKTSEVNDEKIKMEKIFVQDILNSISFMSYEFKDIYLKYNSEGVEEILSTEELESTPEGFIITRSPIFCKEIINSSANSSILSVIFNDIPYYHTKPTNLFALGIDSVLISESRDPSIIDVPSVLQTPFWTTLFRDSFGDITNNFILDIHNKLKYPFIAENQYINAGLFPRIAQQVYTEDTSGEAGTLIEFKYDNEDNSNDIENGDQGCVEYLDSVINSKILSLYNLLDYHPDQAGILSAWTESKYWSGKLEESDIEREKTIYRLQDIKYELLRRKFAGSSTLYNISFSAIDRRGSFVNTTALGNLNIDDSSRQFDDKRIARVLDLPGLLTEVLPVTSYDPINTFYTQPNRKNQDAISLDLLVPLFYSSAPITVDIGETLPQVKDFVGNNYSSDSFLKDIDNLNTEAYENISKNPYVDYRSYFLRNVGRTVNWDTPESTVNTRSLRTVYPKLDYYEENLELENVHNYRKLDGPYEDKGRDYTYPVITLDLESSILRSTEFTSSVMDLAADTILYNENSYQKILGEAYPYITYPLANNNSLSMMDIPWLDYIKTSTISKSRVQDIVNYGTQISTLNVLDNSSQTALYSFFAISYGDEYVNSDFNYLTNTNENTVHPFCSYSEFVEKYDRKPTRAYVWYVTLHYEVYNEEEDLLDDNFSYSDKFRISNAEVYPITIISLALDSFKNPEYNPDGEEGISKYIGYYENFNLDLEDKFSVIDTFEDFKKYNTGIIPLTYSQFKISDTYDDFKLPKNNLFINRQQFLDGVISRSALENDHFEIYTSLEEQDLTRAYFVFSNYNVGTNLTGSKTWGFFDEDNNITLAGPSEEKEHERDDLFTLKSSDNSALKNFGINNIFSMTPSEETKTVYYTLSRPYSGTADKDKVFTWSSPIPVVSLGIDTFKALIHINSETKSLRSITRSTSEVDNTQVSYLTYRPDWFKLGYFLNPNLNFSDQTASPLNGKDTLSSTHRNIETNELDDIFERQILKGSLEKEVVSTYKKTEDGQIAYDNSNKPIIETITRISEITGGATTSSILSNLTRVRGMDFLCNDDGRLNICKELGSNDDNDFVIPGTYCYNPTEHSSQIIYEQDNPTLGFFLEKVVTKAGFSSGAAEFNDYLGIYGDNRQEDSYDTILSREGFIRSTTFSDPVLGVYGLYFENHTDEDTEKLGLNPSRKNLNYYQLVPFRTQDTPICELLYNKDTQAISFKDNNSQPHIAGSEITIPSVDINNWYINKQIKREKGFSMFFNVRIIKDKLEFYHRIENLDTSIVEYTSDNEILTLYKSNNTLLTLQLKRGNNEETIKVVHNNDYDNGVIVTSLDSNLRIGCSIAEDAVLLTVNDKVKKISFTEKLENLMQDNVVLFTELINVNNETQQVNNFKGIVYDYRLYGRPMTSNLELLLTNQGTVRELYSYSPDIYKLAEHIHRELGIFKVQKAGLDDLPEISSIRIFNRGTWDSMLVDRYPISNNEIDSRSLQYTDNQYTNVSKFTLDKDIFIKTITKESLNEEGIVTETIDHDFNDAIQQKLTPVIEVVNGFRPLEEECTLYYQGNPILLDATKDYSLVTTTLKSTNYQNEPLTSGGQISWNTETKNYNTNKKPIHMPIASVGNTLKYSNDMYVNFTLEDSGDLANGISYGSNTSRRWNNTLNRPTIKIKDVSNSKDNENFSETTFIIPSQLPTNDSIKDITKELGLLDKFYLKDFVFGKDFTKYLDVNNYYSEFCIPYYFGGDNNKLDSYGLKWYGIKQLREGVYYFTIKHPAKIHPFEKSRYEKQAEAGEFPTYNLASRFKLVVKGTPVEYSEDNEYLEKHSYHNYCKKDILVNSLTTGKTRYSSTNCRSFPHRNIDIDLYVLDSTGPVEKNTAIVITENSQINTSFYWKKIVSNHHINEDSADTITHLTELTNGQLAVTQEIPMFFTDSLETPFFVAQETIDNSTGEHNYSSKVPVVNTIEPLKIRWLDSIEDYEKLTVNNNSDFESITLIAGRAYRLLLCLSSKVSEVSYSNNLENNFDNTTESILFSINDVENCYRAHSLIHSFASTRDFRYTENPSNTLISDINNNIKNKQEGCLGFETTNGSFISADIDSNLLGDPYSKSSKDNLLYTLVDVDFEKNYRTLLDNLMVIPYRPTRITYDSTPKCFLEVFPSKVTLYNEVSGASDSPDDFSFTGILTSLFSSSNLDTEQSHFITEYSSIKPSILGRITAGNWNAANDKSYIGAVSYKLYEYREPNRDYSLTTELKTPIYKSLYLNNLIKDINFLNSNRWDIFTSSESIVEGTVYPKGSMDTLNKTEYSEYFGYKQDTLYGRDIFTIKGTSDYKTVRFVYKPLGNTPIGNMTDFEVVLVMNKKITSNSNLQVRIIPLSTTDSSTSVFLQDHIINLKDMRRVDKENNYFEYSTTLSLPEDKSMTSIAVEFSNVSNDSTSSIPECSIANIFVRYRKHFTEHSRTFVFNTASSTTEPAASKLSFHTNCTATSTIPARYLAYRNENTKYFLPIQVPSQKRDTDDLYNLRDNWLSYDSLYLEEENLNNGVGWRRILPPWVRKLTFEEISNLDGSSSIQSTSGPECNFGLKSCIVTKTNDGFKVVEGSSTLGVFKNIEMSYDDTSNILNINNIDISTKETGYLKGALEDYPLNLKVNLKGDGGYLPITLLDEKVSGITNSFYPNRFLNNISSPIVVTNVQYLDKEDNVLYEYEFLPIVYDETIHHISFNTLLVK